MLGIGGRIETTRKKLEVSISLKDDADIISKITENAFDRRYQRQSIEEHTASHRVV